MLLVLGGIAVTVWLLVSLVTSFETAVILLPFVLVAAAVGAYIDGYKRTSVVFYDLEGEANDIYLAMVGAFENLAACNGKWHVAAGGTVRDLDTWKRNAGASHLVKKSRTSLSFKLPSILKSNVTPPSMDVGKQTLFFLPDMILMAEGRRFGTVGYDDLTITHQHSRFIEDGVVPSDARVVDKTWRYVNKKGGPDRRFKDNPEIPICLYETMHLSNSSGLNELLEFSRTGVAGPFSDAIKRLSVALAKTASVARLELREHNT